MLLLVDLSLQRLCQTIDLFNQLYNQLVIFITLFIMREMAFHIDMFRFKL